MLSMRHFSADCRRLAACAQRAGRRGAAVLAAVWAAGAAAGVNHVAPVRAMQIVQPVPGVSLALPPGWVVHPIGPTAFSASPPGAQEPSIYFLPAVRVSDLRYNAILQQANRAFALNPLGAPSVMNAVRAAVQAQLADSSYRWSPAQALSALMQAFSPPGSGVHFGAPEIRASARPDTIDYRLRMEKPNGAFADWGSLTMTYLDNPLLAQSFRRPGVTSLAFVSGCEAPAEEAETFEATCAQALASLHMAPQWYPNLAAQVMQAYQQEYNTLLGMGQNAAANAALRNAMISSFGARIQQMQYQTYETMRRANLHNAENWIATLGNQVNMQDPNTGKVYTVPAGASSYCLDDTGQAVLYGRDIARGQWVGHHVCATPLKQW